MPRTSDPQPDEDGWNAGGRNGATAVAAPAQGSANAKAAATANANAGGWQGMETAWVVLSELISAIAVWGGIGFGLDRLFHTWPVLFAIGMVIGYAAGAYLIYRQSFATDATPNVAARQRKDESKP